MRLIHTVPAPLKRTVVTFIIVSLLPFDSVVTSLRASSADGQRNSARAHRIVNELGIGQHVDATLSGGARIRGEIRQIAEDHFVVMLHGTVTPMSIAYGHVRQLRPLGQQPSVRKGRSRIRVLHGIFLAAMYVLHIAECDKAC